jgi:hypothetical protein
MATTQYLLPSTCGQKLPVDAGLAGASVTCTCGQTLQVPTLRGLRALEKTGAPEQAAVASAERTRSPLGCAFTACLLLAVVSGGASLLFWLVRFGIDTSETIESAVASDHAIVDKLTLDQTFDLWKMYTTEGLGAQNAPEFIRNLKLAALLSLWGWITLVTATVSLLAAIGLAWWSIVSRPGEPNAT